MTKRQLIETLSQCSDETLVFIPCGRSMFVAPQIEVKPVCITANGERACIPATSFDVVQNVIILS